MLKKSSLRKIGIGVFCLLILLILYIFPKNNANNYIAKTSYKVSNTTDIVYLIDSNGLVSRINISLTSTNINDKVLEILEYLTVDGKYKNLLPNGFKAPIPAGTKVLSSAIEDKCLKINFSNKLLEVDVKDEIKMIESLIYSLTSIDGIDSILIFVEDSLLTNLPSSNEMLPNPLDRRYGINKKYDINNIKGTTKTTLFYLSKNGDFYYYIPVTKISNDKNEKIEIIIKELTSSPIHETNLMSYLNSEAMLKNYEFVDKSLNLDFNNQILSDITNKSLLEEVTYAINLSIKNNYEIDSVSYVVDDIKIATFDLKNLE